MNNLGPIPDGKPLNIDIRKNVGNALTGPNPQPAPKTAKEAKERAFADINKFAIQHSRPDPIKYDKPFTFNSDVNGQNFDRYYAHPKFKQLGFSPFRDNETVYNQNSSLWDDTQRAGKQWFPLAGLAVSGTFGNWDDLLSGKPDVDNAIEMERYMNIGSSSREGFGAKALNFGVNSAYTFGVIGSILAEEAALIAASRIPGMQGLAVLGTGKNALRLGKAFDRLADVFRTGSNINDARKTWDAVGKVSRAILPFQNTADLFRTAERTKMGWDKMDDFAKAYHSFGSFYRDLREINLVTSEAKLEGGFVQNDVANELIKKFREKEGRDPNDNEVQGIYDQALKAGFKTSYANMAGIYASNKVVLNKLLKGIPGMAPLEHAASKSVRGSIVKNTDWLKTGKNPYEVLYGIGRVANKEYLKQSLKNIPKNSLRYLSANVMEGSQEVYQEAVAEAMKKYYVESYNDPSRAHQGFMKEALEHGLKSQMSGQGLETFLSGFFMAGPIQVANLALTKTGQYTQMLNLKRQEKAFTADPNNAGKENPYTKKLNEFKEWDTKVVTALNDLTKNKKEYFSKLYRNAKEQKDLADLYEDSVLNGDNKTAIDTRDDSLFAHIRTLRKSGTLDLFKEQLNGLSELSDEELAEAFNEKDGPNPVDNKTISQRIQTVLGRIDDIDKHLTEVEKIANPYDPKTNFFNWFGFEEARELIAYNDYSYKRTGDRMISIQEDIKKMMGSVGLDPMYADIANLFSVGRGGNILMGAVDNMGMETELDLLRQEIDNLKGATEPELVKKRNQLSAKRNTLQKLSVSVQNAVTAYKLLNAQNLTDEEKQDNIERVTEAEKLLYDAFKDHLTTAATRGTAGAAMGIFDKTIDQLFEKYKDYWKLDADKANIANAINMLYNPEVFAQSVERLSNAAAEADSVKAEQAKKMAIEYQKRYATNDFLNDLLSQFNVFVSEEEAEAYLNNDIVPTKFINADTGYEIDPRRDAEKYNKILDLIDQYDEIFFERTGQRLFKPTREDIGARIAGTVTGTDKEISELVPEFQAGDKRTLTDLAAEYGFDKGRNESQVKLDTILNAIISNKFATQAQKELARKLITLIDKTELVTFRSNHYTNSTYDTQNGIIIDPRYSSSDFGAKVSVPLEYSILNAAMQKVITDSLSDKTFADKISELRKLAVNGSNDTEKLLFKYAFANDRSFLGELLTNGDFQQHLANIEYTGEQTELTKEAATMWSKFLDILNDLLKNILNFNKSVYREAMAVTLNKLSQPSTGTKTTPTQPGPNAPSPSPIDVDKQDAELMKKLRDKYDAIIAGMSPEDASRMNFDSWMMSDSRALEITRKHKADKIRQQASGTQTGGAPLVTAAVKKNALTSIGFTIEEINAMSEDQIDDNYNKREELAKGFVTNLNREDWGDIDTQMNAAKEKAATLNLALTADSKQYVQYDESGNPIPGTERERVSDVVKENKSSVNNVAAARGNIIDALYKKYLLGDIQSFEEFKKYYTEVQKKPKNAYVNFNDAMLEDLFDIVRNVQRELNKKGLKVIPDFPIISGMLGNIPTAGEMDILAYNKAGKIFIIDMKSSYTNRRLAYDVYNKMSAALGDKFTEFAKKLKDNEYFIKKTIDSYTDPAERALIEDKLDEILSKFPVEKSSLAEGNDVKAQIFYVIDDRAQQLAYKELLRQNTGLEVDSINIFPIITSTAKSGIMSQAQLEREILSITENEQGQNVIRVGGYSIAVDNSKTVYDLNLPKVTQTVTTYPENPIKKPGASTAQPTTTAGTFTPTTTYGTPTGPELTTATPTSTDTKADIEKDEQGNFVPKKYTLNVRGENPAPNISVSAIDLQASGLEDLTDVKQVKLLEIRGKNSEGKTVGTVWIQKQDGQSYDAEVFFNDAELDALEGGKEEPTKTYDNKPVAKSLQGKVIYITPDSYTVGDMSKHSEDLVLGSDLVKEAILELDVDAIKARLEVLAQDKGKIGVSAKALLDFVNKNGINADNITGKGNFLYKLATLERDGDSSISSMIYPAALSKANAIVSDTNKTVVFDTPSVLPYGRIDLAILNGKSAFTLNAPITPTGRTGIADKEALFTGTKKRVMTDSSESIITGGPKSQIPKKLKDIRALINGINNKQELDNTMLMLETLGKTGVLEELLKDQNLSFDEYSALKNQKREQISKQLSIKDLVNKGENTLVRFLNKKNEERIGLVIGETEDNKLEIKDVTDEYNSGIQGKLFIDVDDLSYAGLGSKAKSLKLAERDVNEKVLGIMEEKKVDKSDTTTKQQSNSGQDAADQSVNERKQSLEGYDPFNKKQQEDNNGDLFSSCGN